MPVQREELPPLMAKYFSELSVSPNKLRIVVDRAPPSPPLWMDHSDRILMTAELSNKRVRMDRQQQEVDTDLPPLLPLLDYMESRSKSLEPSKR